LREYLVGAATIYFFLILIFRVNSNPMFNKSVNAFMTFTDSLVLYFYLCAIIQIVGQIADY